jgi:hypothetical protein
MPKIKQDEEEFEEDSEEEFSEDDVEDELEEEEIIEKKPSKQIRRENPKKNPIRETEPIQGQKIKRRFGLVDATPIRMVDMESREVVGEGEYLIAQALTDIIERLERIENSLGSMLDR